MKSLKFTIASGYLLLMVLMITIGYIALRSSPKRLIAVIQITPQVQTQSNTDRVVGDSTVSAIEETIPMDKVPPSVTIFAIEEGFASTPYPEPLADIGTLAPQSLAYPGQGTEQPNATQLLNSQATPTTLTQGATPVATMTIKETPLFNPVQSPTAMVTLDVIRTEIQPSDPSSFQIVSGKVQFVEFFAFWSPISQSMAPVVNVLADRYKEQVNFVFLDIDSPENGLYKQLINNRLPPIFLLLDRQGNVVNEWEGYVPADDLERAIQSSLP